MSTQRSNSHLLTPKTSIILSRKSKMIKVTPKFKKKIKNIAHCSSISRSSKTSNKTSQRVTSLSANVSNISKAKEKYIKSLKKTKQVLGIRVKDKQEGKETRFDYL